METQLGLNGKPYLLFDHDMWKLPPGIMSDTAQLLHVQGIHTKDQTPAFLEFDTRQRPKGHYKLTPGFHAFLLFKYRGAIFQTLRKCENEFGKLDIPKLDRYRSLVGAHFTIDKSSFPSQVSEDLRLDYICPHCGCDTRQEYTHADPTQQEKVQRPPK
jgi:hypothetical protein